MDVCKTLFFPRIYLGNGQIFKAWLAKIFLHCETAMKKISPFFALLSVIVARDLGW